MKMKIQFRHLFFILICPTIFVVAQEGSITNLIYEGNQKVEEKEYLLAETNYRKALSDAPERNEALHNLGNVHYENDQFDEASQRFFQAQKFALTKAERHLAFHNMGNVFMKKKDYAQAVEAYKNALRNNPQDDETRYNYALAKELLEKEKQQQQEEQDDQKKQDQKDQQEKQDQEKDNQGEKDQEQESDQKDKGDEGEEEKQDGDPEEKEGDQSPQPGNSDQQENKTPPPPREGQLSPQQVQSLLEAMNNQEKNVQEKVNAQKVNAVPVRGKKDW